MLNLDNLDEIVRVCDGLTLTEMVVLEAFEYSPATTIDEVAELKFVSPRTISFHLLNTYGKMRAFGVKNVLGALKIYRLYRELKDKANGGSEYVACTSKDNA